MKKIVLTIVQLGVAFIIGFAGAAFFDDWVVEYTGAIGWSWLETIVLVGVLIISFFIHVILHEAGHLLGGLASNYSFVMFRIFHFMWVKENGQIVRRNQKSEGILGQCLMVPPKEQEYPPFVLYHSGGLLMNCILMLIASVIAAMFSPSIVSVYLYGFIAIGAFLVVTNLIPLWQNDGKNIWQSMRFKEYQKVIARTLEIYADLVRGKDYAQIKETIWYNPKEPATGPNNAFMKSIEANGYMSQNQYEKACELLLPLVEEKDKLFEAHRMEMMRGVLFLLLLTNPEHPKVKELMESKEYKGIKQLNETDAKRTMAMVEWVVNQDREKAQSYVEEAKELLEKAPTLSDQKLEQKILHQVQMLISETSEEV